MPAPQTAITDIRVRAVQGRRVDPFRGGLDEGPERLASRSVDSQPFDDVVSAIEGMAGVRLEKAGRRMRLRRGDESLKVAFVSAAPRVSLDDLVLEGDGRLAISVMHALLPWFGPVEMRIGRFDALVDGHEPAAALVEAYDAWFVEDSLRVAKKLNRAEPVATAPVASIRYRRVSGLWVSGVALLFAIGLVIIGVATAPKKHVRGELGDRCGLNQDCQSQQCLGDVGKPAVCVKRCATSMDCPATMECSSIVVTDLFATVEESRQRGGFCLPLSWRP